MAGGFAEGIGQFIIPGIYPDGSDGPDFRFFIMGYVEGIAVDKKLMKPL